MPLGTKKGNLRASEEREKAIQAATKAVIEGQSNAPMPLIRHDRLAVVFSMTIKGDRKYPINCIFSYLEHKTLCT